MRNQYYEGIMDTKREVALRMAKRGYAAPIIAYAVDTDESWVKRLIEHATEMEVDQILENES